MTDYKSMFEQAVSTLAAIDRALDIGDDGCCDPDQTLDAIYNLKASPISEEAMDILRAENMRLKNQAETLARTVMADQTSHDMRKPLTSAQIRLIETETAGSVLHNHPTDAEAFARAIERAHGIEA